MVFSLKSASFIDYEDIPSQYTCEGPGISPPLQWSGVPKGTQSLVLIMDDPDAPAGTWVHWLMYNIPPQTNGLVENAPLPVGAGLGINSWGEPGYGGPCPPTGSHRYFFKLYALDTKLKIHETHLLKQALLDAMQGHVIEKVELVGLYEKQNK